MGIALVDMLAMRRWPSSIEVIGFSEEEGVRFGLPFIGSRALVGSIDEAMLATRDANGTSVREAIAGFGLDPSRIGEARTMSPALGYLEFHIEQGPVLDMRGLAIAVVERIVGLSRAEVRFTGVSAHAGTTPMNVRRDALAGAAEWISSVERAAHDMPGLVATTGKIEVAPGATNVIPGECRAMLDVRHAEDVTRLAAVERFRSMAAEVAMRRGLTCDWHSRLEHPATAMSPPLVAMLARAVASTGTPELLMTSGAGHDAMVLAPHMPAAMLFIRSPHGVSHHPDESVDEGDVAAALAAGRSFLDLLADAVNG